MTAAELFEVVKDVPKEAWPSGVYCHKGLWWKHQPYDDGTRSSRLGPQTAEAAFIGSMTAWRSKTRTVAVCGTTVKVGSSLTPLREWDEYRASSLVAALAAACKEVGGNGG